MAVNRQKMQRLEAWIRALEQDLFTPFAVLSAEAAFTGDTLTRPEAEKLSFTPVAEGTEWGDFCLYGWFRTGFTVPDKYAGRRVVFLSGLGGEQLVFVNGEAAGSIDRQHPYVTLTRGAAGGERFSLLVESFSGNGPRLENTLPVPAEKEAFDKNADCTCRVTQSRAAVFNEEAYQLLMDARVLLGLLPYQEKEPRRARDILTALDEMTHTADPELPYDERMRSFRAARECLRVALSEKNGEDAPVLHLIGQSHIDLAWMWPMEETRHKVRRTFANQLSMAEEYPEYRFLVCEPRLLEMLKETDPALFERMKRKIETGQMIPDGAFYAECDTNIPSGESLARQLLWGKNWFREELGKETRAAWQPDTFGFCAQLPQLLKGFGVPYFATQKLLRADPECERFPYQDFMWEGIDGTRVQSLSFFKSNARTDPQNLWERWNRHSNPCGDADSQLYPFGFGDGGGGADRDMLEYLAREEDLAGLPKTKWSSLSGYFDAVTDRARKHVWRGELYLCWHRGTYTVQRGTKRGIKELERVLHDAELTVCLLPENARRAYLLEIKECWRVLLTHQFHDIAAGVGVACVHAQAEQALREATGRAEALLRRAADEAFPKEGEGFTLFNPLPFERREFLSLPGLGQGFVTLPPSGCRVFDGFEEEETGVKCVRRGEVLVLENGILSFELWPDGTVRALRDLRSGREVQRPGQKMNELRLYKNVEPVYDAWELSRDHIRDRIPDAVKDIRVSVGTLGRDEVTVRVSGTAGNSPFEQTVTLRAGDDRVLFSLRVCWRERHKLLRACFETALECEDALHGVQFGHIARPAHERTAFARDRYEVCSQGWSAYFEQDRGVALLKRDIFGIRCRDGEMDLTLLRAPCVPDDTCDRGEHVLEYAVLVSDGPFEQSGLPLRSEAFLNAPRLLRGKRQSTHSFQSENILLDTVKPAENGCGTVLRLHEYTGKAVSAKVFFGKDVLWSPCSMEEEPRGAFCRGRVAELSLRPFEIVTLLLREI